MATLVPDPELTLNPRIAQWTVQAFTRLLATYAVILGAIIAVAGDGRFSGVQYKTTQALPGFPEAWGVALAAIGALILVASLTGRLRGIEWGAYAASTWQFFFALSLLDVAVENDRISVSPVITHGVVAAAFMLAGVAYHHSRR